MEPTQSVWKEAYNRREIYFNYLPNNFRREPHETFKKELNLKSLSTVLTNVPCIVHLSF